MVWRIIDREDELKNIVRQVLTYNSKNFHWLNKKLDLERTMSELEKQFQKNQIKRNKKQKIRQNTACNKKQLARKGNLVQTKN